MSSREPRTSDSTNDELIEEAYNLPGVTRSVASVMKALKGLGRAAGISRKQVADFLKGKESYQVVQKRKDVPTGTVLPSEKGHFEVDLADMSKSSRHNGGVSWLLVLIDSLTKYLHVIPLKNKSAESVNPAFRDFIRKKKPLEIIGDPGSEFIGNEFKSLLAKEGVALRYVRKGDHAPNAERGIQNVKNMLNAYLDKQGTKRYIDVLKKFVDTYNDTFNSRLKFSPNEMEERPDLAYLSGKIVAKKQFHRLPDVPIGARVRKAINRGIFAKGHQHTWSKTLHTVTAKKHGGEFTHDRYFLDNEDQRWYRSYELQVVKNVADHDPDATEPVHQTRDERAVARELRDLPPVEYPIRARPGKRKVFSHIEVPPRPKLTK